MSTSASPATPSEPETAIPPAEDSTEIPPAEDSTEIPAAEAGPEIPTNGHAPPEAEPVAEAKRDPERGAAKQKRAPSKEKPARSGPRPEDVVRRIGDSAEQAVRYVLAPDAQLSRLSRKIREELITDVPPVTAGALLGPAALARHFVASAASGRYRDLFALWDLFRQRPEDCKPVLAERPQALEKAREALTTAVRLGLRGHAGRVAEDVAAAQGLIWRWLREVLVKELAAVGARPAIASALLRREPDLEVPLPERPDARWLAEAAAAKQEGALAAPLDALLAAHVDRLPATVATLSLAHGHYPDRVPALLDRVDLDAPDVGAILAWARDHGGSERVRDRVRARVADAASADRAAGLALWHAWHERGVEVELPEPLRRHSLDGLDVTRPETAVLLARLRAEGAEIDPQATVEEMAERNRQLAEKTYEAFVCAGLDVTLPTVLEGNPIVKDGTRCPWCRAWTWVRPGHERRCPRRPIDAEASATATADIASSAPPPPGPTSGSTAAVDPAAEWEAGLETGG